MAAAAAGGGSGGGDGGLPLVVVVQRIKSRLWEIDNYTAWKKIHEIH